MDLMPFKFASTILPDELIGLYYPSVLSPYDDEGNMAVVPGPVQPCIEKDDKENSSS